MLQEVRHPSVVRLLEVFDEGADSIFLVTQFAAGGDLFDAVAAEGAWPEGRAKTAIFLLLDAVAHLHRLGIVHRDIKPENILLTCDTKSDAGNSHGSAETRGHHESLLLADLGFARYETDLSNSRQNGVPLCGTPEYMAPEIVLAARHAALVKTGGSQNSVRGNSSSLLPVDRAADVWAVGVVAFVVLGGYLPFGSADDGADNELLFERIAVSALSVE